MSNHVRSGAQTRTYIESGQTSSAIQISNVNPAYPRNTVTVSFFSDAALTTPATPTAGSYSVQGVAQGGQGLTDFNNSPVTAANLGDMATAAAPLESLTVTPTGITGAAYWRVTLISNEA